MKWDATTLRDIARACRRQAKFEEQEAVRMGSTTAAEIFRASQQRFLDYAAELDRLARERS